MGCAGGVENGINTVHLSYVGEKTGHALIGARQWIPAAHIADPVKSLVMGLPPDLVFCTVVLRRRLLQKARRSVPAFCVGSDRQSRASGRHLTDPRRAARLTRRVGGCCS